MNQPGVGPALLQYLTDSIFLAKVFLSDVLNADLLFLRNLLSVLSNQIPKRLSKLWVIEDLDALGIQVGCHSLGITELGKGANQNDSIIAVENANNPILVFFNQVLHNPSQSLWQQGYRRDDRK